MHNWFECKITYEKMLENGMQKKVTEPYLVDALSFTEAEARITEEVQPFITGEFTVKDIKRARLSELFFNENGDRFYKIKVYFTVGREEWGGEKDGRYHVGAGFHAKRGDRSVGGRHERYYGRLFDSRGYRDTNIGRVPVQYGSGKKNG